MKKFLNIFAIVALALGFTACEEPTVEPQPEAQKPTLSVDKSEILANGADKATFTATVEGVENADIQIISLKDNSILSGNTFTTTEPGKYQFKAIYGQESSDVVEVTAKEVEKIITLEADTSEIVADDTDTVTFTVKVDGEVVTDNYEITNLNYGIKLEGNTFTSDVTGEFKFQAMYEGKWLSNEVAVVANAVPAPEVKELRLSVSPNRIKADGVEKAVFTVTYGEEDVTLRQRFIAALTLLLLLRATPLAPQQWHHIVSALHTTVRQQVLQRLLMHTTQHLLASTTLAQYSTSMALRVLYMLSRPTTRVSHGATSSQWTRRTCSGQQYMSGATASSTMVIGTHTIHSNIMAWI